MRFIRNIEAVEDKAERLRFILVLCYVFSLPYDILYSSILMILLSVVTLLDVQNLKRTRIPRQFWIFQIVFILTVMGYFYSLHKPEAMFLMERQLSILLFPIFLPLAVRLDTEKLHLILTTLCISTALAILYLFASMFWAVRVDLDLPLAETILSGAFFNHQFSKPLQIHAGYLSLYVALSIFYGTHLYNSNRTFLSKSTLIILLIIFFSGLFFLASRNILIGTFLILVFIYPFYKVRNKLRYVLIMLSILTVCVLMIKNISYLNTRFSVNLITDINPVRNSSGYTYHLDEPRFERWEGALELIARSPFLGYGTGDEICMLKTEYVQRELYISYLENFNAHNQYLSYLLKHGIAGLLLFLAAYAYYLFLAIKAKDFVYLSFLILLLIGFYTENILDANKGIVFFGFFNVLFGYTILLKKKYSGL